MFSLVERKLARRYLLSSRREGFISVIAWFSFLGIALGIGTLIVVMAVMNGFRQELYSAIVGMRGHVMVQAPMGLLKQDEEKLKLIQSIPGVNLAFPLLERHAIAMVKSQARGVVVQGIPLNAITAREKIAKSVVPAQALTQFSEDRVFLGRRLAELLNLRIGDKISLLTPEGSASPFGTLPRQKSFVVAGVFAIGMHEFDKNFIFMPLDTAQAFFKSQGLITQIDVFSSHHELSSSLTYVIQRALGENVRALDWRHSDASIFQAVKVERNVMFLILTLIILIASFNIISGLIMLVKDKTRDIAILRTMGATKQMVLKTFFLTGASIGGVGTLLGVGLGLSFALNIEKIRQFLQSLTGAELFSEEIYFLSTLPAKVDWTEVILASCMGIGLSFLATLYPAFKASRLDPVEGLRFG